MFRSLLSARLNSSLSRFLELYTFFVGKRADLRWARFPWVKEIQGRWTEMALLPWEAMPVLSIQNNPMLLRWLGEFFYHGYVWGGDFIADGKERDPFSLVQGTLAKESAESHWLIDRPSGGGSRANWFKSNFKL